MQLSPSSEALFMFFNKERDKNSIMKWGGLGGASGINDRRKINLSGRINLPSR